MVSPLIVMLSVFITPWMKPTCIHCATSTACVPRHVAQQPEVTPSARRVRRVVPRDGVVGELAHAIGVRRARRSTGRCRRAGGSRRRASAPRRAACARAAPARRWRRQPARVWSGCPSACIASPISTSRSIGAERRLAIAPLRENGVRPQPLSARSRRRPCRSITSPISSARPSPSCGLKPTELVPGIGLCDGLGTRRQGVAGKSARRGRPRRGVPGRAAVLRPGRD
jgi:hypothetical protein